MKKLHITRTSVGCRAVVCFADEVARAARTLQSTDAIVAMEVATVAEARRWRWVELGAAALAGAGDDRELARRAWYALGQAHVECAVVDGRVYARDDRGAWHHTALLPTFVLEKPTKTEETTWPTSTT
jgi:hypothetical protein